MTARKGSSTVRCDAATAEDGPTARYRPRDKNHSLNTTAKSNVVTMLKRVVDAVLPQRQFAFAA
jgi:hypothetical protein